MELVKHIESFLASIGAAVGGAEHSLLNTFFGFAQTKQKSLDDAQALLVAAGYTVTAPATNQTEAQ